MAWLNRRTFRRSLGTGMVVLAVGLLASGCDWYQLGDFSGHGGDNPETTITPANVSTLTARFSATDGTSSGVTPQAVVSGVLYASDASGLKSYSADATSGCTGSPEVCSPLWSYSPGPPVGAVAVGGNVVYYSTSTGLYAFDATGHTNCSGAPTVCQPLWSAAGDFGTPTLSNGTVYVIAAGNLDAFDASGTTNCTGVPKTCLPVWTAHSVYGTVTVSAGIAYAETYVGAGSYGGVVALDANGTRGCSGTPKVCTPLWEYATNYPAVGGYAVVSGTTLYVVTFYSSRPMQFTGDTEAFDANGVDECGSTPKVCGPLWANPVFTLNSAPLAGDGSEFVSVPVGIYALDANGSLSAPGGAEFKTGNSDLALALGGAVLYGTDGTDVYAYDAGGSSGCSGSPKVCTSLWSAPGTGAIVANGTLYVSTKGSSGNGEVVGYGLPS